MHKTERDRIIMSYSKLVWYKVTQINNDKWIRDNLYQEGMLAVCKAVDNYTPNSTYTRLQAVSFAVSAAICRHIRRYSSIIPIKHNSDATDRAIVMLRKTAGVKDIKFTDLKHIADNTNTDISLLQDAYNTMSTQFISTEEITHEADEQDYQILYKTIKKALPSLTNVEKQALAYLLQDKSLAELARQRGVSKQASQEAGRRALKKLRQQFASKNVQFSDII